MECYLRKNGIIFLNDSNAGHSFIKLNPSIFVISIQPVFSILVNPSLVTRGQ
jgi:hypothetical protein